MHQRFDTLESEHTELRKKLFFGVNTETLAATRVIDPDDAILQYLDPGGAGRNVDLPAEANARGQMFLIVNTADAAENLTVRNDAAGTIGVVGQNEMGMFVCNGTDWRHFTGVA